MINLLRGRRSIRNYQNKKIEPEKVEILKEALLRSPTSKDNQAWEFIFVDDKTLLQKLSESRPHGASFLKNAALAVVICDDERQSDVWVENCAIAATFLQLTAYSLNLGSCWVQVRNRMFAEFQTTETYIRKLLNLPQHLRVASIISIGYPAEKKEAVPVEQLHYEKIHSNSFD